MSKDTLSVKEAQFRDLLPLFVKHVFPKRYLFFPTQLDFPTIFSLLSCSAYTGYSIEYSSDQKMVNITLSETNKLSVFSYTLPCVCHPEYEVLLAIQIALLKHHGVEITD